MIQLNMNTYASTKDKSAICMDCRLEHRDVEGATYIKIIILIINVTIIITIIVLYEGRSRVPIHAKSPTPSLKKLRPRFDFADPMLWNGKLQKQLTRSRAIG